VTRGKNKARSLPEASDFFVIKITIKMQTRKWKYQKSNVYHKKSQRDEHAGITQHQGNHDLK
jgi:hypothetical protein